ncbi:unnamed protein product [Lampetra fluviatilis]
MDQVGWDSLSIKKLLLLAQKLQVVLPATEDDNLLSFKVARYLEANVNIRRRAGVVASTGPSAVEERAPMGKRHLQAGVASPRCKVEEGRGRPPRRARPVEGGFPSPGPSEKVQPSSASSSSADQPSSSSSQEGPGPLSQSYALAENAIF